MARSVVFNFRKGSGAGSEILYGVVELKPTLMHSVGTSAVLPVATKADLVDGKVTIPNVAPSPAPDPVEGTVEWAYNVKVLDRFGKQFEWLVGVPDAVTPINFVELPRYFETKPPLFGQGPQGVPGNAATIQIGTVGSGVSPSITNVGTSQNAVLDFVLQQGPVGPTGVGVPAGGTALQMVRKNAANTATEWATVDKALVGLGNVDNTSDANKPVSTAQATAIADSDVLPYRSKLTTDLPSSYPHGSTVFLGMTADGWPMTDAGSSEFSIVRTDKPRDYGVAIQYVSAYNTSSVGDSIDNPVLMYRIGTAGDRWSEFQTVATGTDLVREGGEGVVHAAFYGAVGAIVGDGINNDYWTIQRAINAGKEVILEGGKTYLCAGTLSMPADGRKTVSIRATGSQPAILKIGAGGQSYSAIDFKSDTIVTTTTLTTTMRNGGHGWYVASATGIEPGMICTVKSSASWYFDPRPESSDARKSELHKVREVIGNQVFFYDPANDGYDITLETVTLDFYSPIKVRLENLMIQGTLPPAAESTGAVIGVKVSQADSPELINVSTDSCARTGISPTLCYRPLIRGGHSIRSNNFFNGYGVQFSGCNYGVVENRLNFLCRRGVDVSGGQIISRNTRLDSCIAVGGGGKNSQGTTYGWTEAGVQGADQYGFGTHGPADQTEYVNCTTLGIMRPYSMRGRDERVVNFRHVGRTNGSIFQMGNGTNLFIQGGLATSGAWSYKQAAGGSSVLGPNFRPDGLVRIYDGYQYNTPSSTQRGRTIIDGVVAELRDTGVWIQNPLPISYPLGELVIRNCSFQFWSATTPYVVKMDIDPAATSKAKTFIGPNTITTDAGTAPVLSNYPLTGASILNYTVI